MRRIAITLFVFLLLGAVVNVAVAWGCAVWSEQVTDPTARIEVMGDVPDKFSGILQPEWLNVASPETALMVKRNQALGWECDKLEVWHMVPGVMTGSPHHTAYVINAGWPSEALHGKGFSITSEVLGRSDGQGHWQLAFESPEFLHPFNFGRTGDKRFPRPLPFAPIWPGFAINTLFYATILWLLFAFPFTLRRWRRVRRGLCAKCAYPVGASDVCTECGAVVTPSS